MSADEAAPRGARKHTRVHAGGRRIHSQHSGGASHAKGTSLIAAEKKRVRRAVAVRTRECPACAERFSLAFAWDREPEVMEAVKLVLGRCRHDAPCELGAPGDEAARYAWRCPRCEVALTWRHVTEADAELLIAQGITLGARLPAALLEERVEQPRESFDWPVVDAR